ncbi:beta-lactamase-like protein 2 [Rhodotorula toruloides]|uniref:Beta-lactamase-like protein n=1 Tax=Rhodotorula toruloides TaxID=5286 RepID=A0A0K3CGX1_RHOTO|nr:beta-lactamase-like protein 2 [Rhodotorula toruloides]PRQ73545.1 Beta-lactamase-like protein [Rhodotorula toruloides]
MASLPELPGVSTLSKYVTRVLGQNPGKFTLQGTNTYLVYHPASPSLLLLDTTGPSSASPLSSSALQTYLSSLRSAIASHPTQPARITDIILTHWHRDHTAAVGDVVRMLAKLNGAEEAKVRVWKFPCATGEGGSSDAWKSERTKDAELERDLEGLGGNELERTSDGTALHTLRAGQQFSLAPSGASPATNNTEDGVEFEVVHTPGHTSDSICVLLRDLSSSSPSSSATSPLALFTADTVLGHGTAVFASLSAYLSSLASLIDLLSTSGSAPIPLYPGHGEVVTDGLAKIKEYKTHREDREKQVVEALKAVEGGEAVTAGELTDSIYADTIPSSLKLAATHGLLLHLEKLREEGRVGRVAQPSPEGLDLGAAGGGGEVQIPQGWFDGWRWVEASEAVEGRL